MYFITMPKASYYDRKLDFKSPLNAESMALLYHSFGVLVYEGNALL